jgi:hypothetical protein
MAIKPKAVTTWQQNQLPPPRCNSMLHCGGLLASHGISATTQWFDTKKSQITAPVRSRRAVG